MSRHRLNSSQLAPKARRRLLCEAAPLTGQQLAEIARRAQTVDAGNAELDHWNIVRGAPAAHVRLALAPPTAFEIADAVAAYDATRPGLGEAFIAQLEYALGRIARDPEIAPAIGVGVHRADLLRFPYCIVYRMQSAGPHVLGVFPRYALPSYVLSTSPATAPSS